MYYKPTAQSLINQVIADMSSALGFQILPGTREYIFAVSVALLADDQYGEIAYAELQQNLATCSAPYIDVWGAIKNVTRLAAAPASGTIAFTGNNGALAPTGTLVSLANGYLYQTQADFTVGTTASVPLVCQTAAANSNAPVNAPVTIYSTVSGITGAALQSALTGGADLESDTAYRTRIIIAIRNAAGCGSQGDFLNWALATPGVTRAWVQPGFGTVTIFPMFDVSEAVNYGFPQGTGGISQFETRNYGPVATLDLLAVANSVFTPQPIPCVVLVQAPTQFDVTVQISGLGLTNTWTDGTWTTTATSLEISILEALQALMVLQGNALGGTIQENLLYDAILAAVGTQTFTVDSPTTPITNPSGTLPFIYSVVLTP